MQSRKNIPIVVIGVFLCAVLMLAAQAAANPPSMKGYCIQPPFLVAPKQPNVLIILDNSGSMNCLAYQSEYNPAQFTTGTYYGYFDPALNYIYDTSSSTATNPNRWIPTNAPMNTGTVTNPIASGNLLNWISMSRQDIAKKLLVGGRAATGTGTGTPSSIGAYNVADRTTNPVKLYGNSDATTSLSCTTNVKTHDSTSDNLIYPFQDVYDYTVQTGQANTFTVTYSGPAKTPIKLYPNMNYPGSNPVYTFPTAWVPSTGTLANAYQTVDETGAANTSDYITNKSTTEQALFDFNHADAALLAAAATGDTISSITVHAYAKKASSSTVYLQAVLWGAVAGPDMVQPSGLSSLSTSWADRPFDYPTNPTTGAAWQWSDFTSTTGLQRLKAFGVMSSLSNGGSPTSTKYATVAQVYIQINIATPPDGGPYKIIVDQGSTPAAGILDSMSSEVRFGLAQYTSSNGGKIADTSATTPTYVDSGNVPNIIKAISNTIGSTSTPLAETLYEMERYFRQESTYYTSSDYTKGCATASSGTSSCTGASVNTHDPYFYGGSINQYVPCTQSYILLLTDGESNSDVSLPGTSTTSPYAPCSLTNIKGCSGCLSTSTCSAATTKNPRYGGTPVGQTYTGSGSDYLVDVAFWGRTNDMRPGTFDTTIPLTWQQGLPNNQNINLYTVFLFGSGSTLLQDAAIYGGFSDINGNGIPDCTTKPEECYRDSNGDGIITSVRHSFCSNEAPTYATTCLTNADCSGGTCMDPDSPITYYEGDDGYKLQASISSALTEILKRAASGTAASVLASGGGSGANLLQSIFYPKRSISGQSDITWTSTVENLWYYLNTATNASSIRENTTDTGSTYELNTTLDRIISFYFDKSAQMTKANLYTDANGDGVADSASPAAVVDATNIKSLWEAGLMLWNTSSGECTGGLTPPACRRIWTNVNNTTNATNISPTGYAAATTAFAGMKEFRTGEIATPTSTPTLQSLLNTDKTVGTGAGQRQAGNNTTVAKNVINYVRGFDGVCSITTTQGCVPQNPSLVPCPAGETCKVSVTFASPAETITYRTRSTAIDLSNPTNGTVNQASVTMPNGQTWSELSKVWKLGDIIDSTPSVLSWIPLNTYYTTYNDSTYSSFTGSSVYKGRGMVFTGANDGMLHAFKLGTLDLSMAAMCTGTTNSCTSDYDCGGAAGSCRSGTIKAKLCEDDGAGGGISGNGKCESGETNKGNLGKEEWAFIPKSALPYLQYFSDPNYCHLYFVDATPYVFDASIEAPGVHTTDYWTQTRKTRCGANLPCTATNKTLDMNNTSWRTILIGGMRLGGACSAPAVCSGTTTICSDDSDCAAGVSCVKTANSVGAPAAAVGSELMGYSSYFAIDVTDPLSPQLMWEFTNPNLGVSSSGPAIVRISARNSSGSGPSDTSTADTTKDGKWFAVFASGPTGPVGTSQFKGFSNQKLRLFVLDLKTGTLLRTIGDGTGDINIPNAFGGSLNNAPIDYNFDYQDDALYMGYVKSEGGASPTWNKGGVLRLITRADLNGRDVSPTAASNGTALNPANWLVTRVVDNIGPVTSSVAHLAHYPLTGNVPDKAYLYFGTGRFFYTLDTTSDQQTTYGVIEPCLSKMTTTSMSGAIIWNGFSSPLSPVCDDNGGSAVTCSTTDQPPAKDMFDPATCLKNATSNSTMTSAPNGWYINLDTSAGSAYSERVITDPVAAQNGVVYFTSFAPNTDICSYGGNTYLWAVKYDTAASVSSVISGIGLIQVSTGAIDEVHMSTDLGDKTDATHKYGRRTNAIDGVPPTGQGIKLVLPPSPTNKIMYIRKR